MANREHPQPGDGPVGLAPPDGLPWARLVTGAVVVVVSLVMSWRATRTPVELPVMEALQPLEEYTVTADPVDRRVAEIVTTTALSETAAQPAAPVEVARVPVTRSARSHKRHQLERTNAIVHGQSDLMAHRKAGMNPRSIGHSRITQVRFIRTRSEVRKEYIAAREQVAALTSEDSGSAYLARLAARQSAARTNLAGQAQSRSQVRRRASAR